MKSKRTFIVLIMLAIILFTNSIVYADVIVPGSNSFVPDIGGNVLMKCIILAFIAAIIVTLVIIFINGGKEKNKK